MQSNLSVRSGRPKQAPGAVVRAPIKTRRGAVIITRKSLFGKQKSVNLRTLRRVCAGFVALAAACGASLAAFAEPVEPADQAAILRTVRAPGNLSAIAEGPERVALSWQAPMASDRSELTGYGIQFSDDGGANWSALPTLGRRTTSFVHAVGLRASATLLYRVFAIGADGAGPAAVATAVLPRTSVPRITAVQLTANQGTVRWYPPRQEVAVTVQFDQTVTVNMTYGTPQIDLEMGRPPHRQSGYASDYSGGSGTDRLTFRYVTGDWNQDLSDIEVAPNALDLNGGRIVNLHATHRASLAHGPASLEVAPQVDARSDAVLVLDTRAPARVPAAPKADLQIARNEQSGSPALAAMLSAAGALVAGTEIVQQLALAEEREVAEFATLEQVSGGQGSDILESVETVAVDLGQGVGPRAAAIPESEIPGAPFLFISEHGQAQLDLSWNLTERDKDEKYNIDVMDYLIEVSEDGASWTNLIGYDTQNNDLYLPLATQPASTTYSHVGLEPGTTHHYRVKARTSNEVEGPWSTGRRDIRDSYATTRPIRPVPECAAAFWSTEITVGSKTQFNQDGYWTNHYGSIADDDFSLGGTDYFVYNAWVADPSQSNPHYHFSVSPAFSDAEREDLTLYVGPVALPLGNTTTRTQQTGYYAYLWTSTDYAETFGYPPVSGASHPYDRFAEYALGDKVTVCLVDATPRVTLTLDPASIFENAETSTITASVSSASDTAFTVTVSAEPDDPAVDADFTLSTNNKVLSFAANATESTGAVTITTVDNDVDAPNKTIQVKGELPGGVPVRAPADVTLTITDDDAAPQLSLSVSPATISEDGGEATITVSTVDSTFVEEQTITLTLEGSATKGTDYTAAAQTLNLGSGERSVTTLVTAIDDSTDESDETILVTAMHDGRTVGIQQQITIADTLAAAVSANSSNVDEGDAAEFTVTLSGGTSTAAVEVDYLVDSDSTATAGDDYAAPTGKLTITAGESGGTITITTNTDQVHDPGETVVLKLASASTDTRTVNVDGTAKAMTTITDTGRVEVSVGPVLVEDDDQTPEDETDDKSSVEEGETASFVVTLSGEVSGTVSVTYTTANGTAESGTGNDYTAASGTLEFTTGQTSKTIDVTTLEDSLNEASETYTLTLTGVSGVTGVSLGTASETGTIEDDDVLTAELGTQTENVPEGSEATFEVDLSGGTSTADVEVTYEVDAISTATSGTDYTAPTSWKLTIAAGESSGTITIGTLDNDGVLDPDETLVLRLTSATTDTRTVTVDATATKTATILEEDEETVAVGAVTVEDDPLTQDVDETDDKSTVEEGETASFVVTLSGEVSGTVSVTYTTANGTAESGTGKDYTTASGTLEFTTGQTSKTIDVTTLEDSLNEASETYTLTLTGVSGVTGVSLEKASATGTIEDDDVLTAALDTHTANVPEGSEATFEVDLSGGTSTADVEVTYEVDASSTATSGTDYTAPTSWKLTIAAGESSGTITIGTLDNDGVLDPGETLVVKLASATTDTRTVTVDATVTKTATILEQDTETVSVGPVLVEDDDQTPEDETDDKSKVEEGETASFVVTLSGEVSGTVSVTYTTANGTAESGTGKDYTAASGTLEFTTGQTSKTIDVTTLEDSLNEASETYTLTLTGVSGVTGVSLEKASATGTIEDDDVLTAALDTHTANVAESDDATFEVDLSGGTSTSAVEVTYEVDASSTATSGTDYTAPTSWKLTIAAGESSGTITIGTLDNDGVLDPGETLVVKLASATTDTRTVTVDATATKTTTIGEQGMETVSVGAVTEEDDPLTEDVDESDDKSKVEEGETASFVVTLSGEVSGTVSVTYTTANGTAESGTGKDYTTASGTLEFTTGQTSKTIDVTTLEDSLNEASETYTLTLTGVSGVTGVSLEKASETGTIEDDDVLTAALNTHTENVPEGSEATFEVDLSGGTSTADVEVTYEVDASSTATSGTDYTAPTSWKLTIAAGESSGTIAIATLDNDGVLDPGETLVVKLASATTDTRTVTVDATATKTATILEQDTETVSVGPVLVEDDDQTPEDETDDKSTVEEGETASFVVTLSGEVSGTVSVTYTTANGTAESGTGNDYTAASGTLEFTTGQTSKTIDVTTLEDSLNEASETYTLTLTGVSGVTGVSLGKASETGTIEDDDVLTAELGTQTENVPEGSEATFEVDLSGGTSTSAVEVTYEVDASSTATSGTDYTAPTSWKLTIAAGESSGTITIGTLDNDGVLDPDETLVLRLTSATTDTRTVTVDATATKTATILEQDEETVAVGAVTVEDDPLTQDVDETDDKSTVEESETASFVVTLSGEVSGTVSVTYTTANGTAESGTGKDYTTASGTLEFTTGQTSKTIDVTTLEDSLNEASETYTLTLTGVSGVTGVSLGKASATGTIEDDDVLTAALDTHTANVAESDDATFEVDLSGGTSTADVEVTYEVDASSTATSGTDYTAPTSWKLTIAAGASSGTITIATLDNDGVLDPGETLVVKLASATTDTRTVTVDAAATKTTTIGEQGMETVAVGAVTVEDDPLTQDVDETDDKSTVEEGETASFVVTLSGEVSGTVSVTYTTANGTAESGTGKDYTTASGTLEFTTGQTSKTIDVTTLEDSLNEASETYTLTLTGVSGVTGVSLGKASETGTIEDDDVLTAALDTHTANVAESDDATFEVDLSGGTSTAAVEVTYEVDASSTATSGTDYTAPTSWKLTIAAGESSGTITIGTLDNDGVLDPGETLVVKLASATTDTRTVTVDAAATKTTTIGEQGMETVAVGAVTVEDDPLTQDVDETDDKSTVEEGETASFVVTLSGEVSGTVSVTYTTANGTAESGTGKDYTAASGTLEFTTGQTSKTIDVTTLEDSLNEASETYTLTLTGVSGVTGVSLGKASETGTIEDDDVLTAALDTHTANVAESDDATFEVDLSGGTSTSAVEVTYEVDASSTATSGTDYTAPTSWKLTIAAGESSGTITIGTLDNDGVLDPGETLVVKLASATTDTRTVTVDATATKTATITDSGMVKVSVQDATASEGDSANFAVELGGTVASDVEVSYQTANGTATSGAGKDYTAATGKLTIFAGATGNTIEVTTLEDVIDEANETFTLTLTASNLPTGVSLDDSEATGTITDDDEVSGVPTGVSAQGANTQATLQWSAPSSPGTSAITGYEYRYKSGTDDYPTTWTSAGGPTATTITVSGLTNDILHAFELRAVSDAGDGEAVEVAATPFWANTAPRFTSTATPSVAENVKLAVTLQATDDDGDTIVSFGITGGADSELFAIDDNSGLLFEIAPNFEDPKDAASTTPANDANNNQYVVVVTVTSGAGDRALTAEQTITVTVTDAEEPPLAPGAPQVDTVSITELRIRWLAPANTGPPITDYDYRYRIKTPQGLWLTVEDTEIQVFEQLITDLQENTEYEVQVRANNGEGVNGNGAWSESGSGETEANASPHFTSSATFEIAENSTGSVGTVTADDTDAEDNVDAYAIVGGKDEGLFEMDGNDALSFKNAPNFEAAQDGLSTTPPNAAGNNQYIVVVRAYSGTVDRLKSSNQIIVVTVTDVDEPPLTPDAPTVVPASPTSLTVTWSDKTDVNRPAATTYNYQYSVKDQETWTEVTDYTATSVTITGLTRETDYEVQVQAKSDEGTSGWSDSGEGTTPVMPVVTLVLGPDSIAEGGVSTVTATVAPAADAAFAIEVSAEADSGNDADVFELSTNVTLQFAADETASTGTVTISAVDNAVDEDDKTVMVSGTVLAGAEVLVAAAQTLTITDDDVLATVTALESTQCDTDSDPSACVEEGNDALFPVTLTGGTTTAAVVIGYEVSSEDATVDVDYTAPSDGLLTIAMGESTGTITVETNGDDDILDPGETLKVTLTSGSTTAGGVQVSETAATMTIADTGEVNLSVADAEAAEGDVMNFAVKLTRKVASGVTFSYQTANETAESGTGKDYTAASGTLTFAADAKIMTVAVTTLEDALDESDETFTLTLTADLPTDVTLTDDVATGTIQDDDTRGVTVSTDAVTVVKGGDSESYTLRLRSQPTGDVTININGPGGGVLVSPTQVTFTPQNWSTTKSVQVSATTDAQADTTPRITHSVSGADYAGQTANHVTVTIQEQTSVGLDLRPKSNTGTSGTAGATGDSGVYTEGETIGFFLKRTSSSQEEVTVMVTLRQNGDYMTGDIPTSVTLLPHEKEKDIPIPTEDDAIVEPDGSVTMTIAACDCAVTTGTLTVDVLNNDAEFAVDNAEAVESEGHITFTVEITGTLQVDMDLNYETTKGGSATAGKDYEKPDDSALVTVPAGKRTATISIPVLDDTLVEGDEWFGMRVFHTVDPDMDRSARGTIRDDDAAVAKAWLARFGRTVASHVVEAVDARLTGELGPTTQVTLGGTTLPSALAPIQPNAVAAMPHTSIEGGAFLAGSSFQVLASESGGESAGTGLTMWGRGAATGLQASDKVVSSLKGQVGTGTVGVDYDWGGILAGLAVAYSGGGADYKLAGDQGRADEAASWLISAHPYARAQILGDRLTAWGLLGYGLGQMTLAADAEDEESGISMMMGALGLRGVLSPETNRFGLTVKTDAFVTRMTAGEGGVVETGAHRARLLAEGTYRMDFGASGVLIPRLVTGVRYDFGDVETGFGAEMGGGVTYTYPAWGLTASGNLRVLLTHQDSGFEQWGGGGSLRVSPGAAGLGPSVAVNTSLGAPASGAQRLFTSGVALGSAPAAAAAPGAHIDAEMGYGLTVLDGGAMVTPYVGMAVAEKGARAFRLGGRLSVGPAFSLSVEGERREETAGAAAHGVSVNGALRW